jgi:hypothetical protein
MTEFQLPYKALPHSEFEVYTMATDTEDFDLDASNVELQCLSRFPFCLVK